VAAANLGQFSVSIGQPAPSDRFAPTASLSAFSPVEGTSNYQFTVTYSDDVAVNISSFDNNDIQVVGPNGFSQQATRVSTNVSLNGTAHGVTYQITAPGGIWDTGDNGSYSIALLANQVSDTSGNLWQQQT
jgi:hypothetical protein